MISEPQNSSITKGSIYILCLSIFLCTNTKRVVAHALDVVTIVDIGSANADAVVDRLEGIRDELSNLLSEAQHHLEIIAGRCRSDRRHLQRLVSSQPDLLYHLILIN